MTMADREYRVELWEKRVVIHRAESLEAARRSVETEVKFKNMSPDRHLVLHSIEDITSEQTTAQKRPQGSP